MPLSRCIRRCWDSQTTKRYFIGAVEDLPENHVFLTMKNPCFVAMSAEDISTSQQDTDAKIRHLSKKIDKLDAKKGEEPLEMMVDVEGKRGPGRPRKE
jgi:hypothetical protein